MPENLIDLFDRDEELVPELRPHVVDGPLGKMVHHPLVIELTHREGKAALVNETYRVKKARVDACRRARDFSGYIFFHERPYRVEALLEILPEIGDRRYWPLVRDVWDDSENIHQHADEWRELWEYGPANLRGLAMTRGERAHLRELPGVVPVWRGSQMAAGKAGMSWTTDRGRAIWFATRWSGKGHLVTGTISRSRILAYLAGRSESEVVCLPEDVDVVHEEMVVRITR